MNPLYSSTSQQDRASLHAQPSVSRLIDLRRFLYALVETGYQGYPPGRTFDITLVTVIVLNIAATAMAT